MRSRPNRALSDWPDHVMTALFRSLRTTLVSLKLTLMLLGFAMVLIFAATLDQVNLGI